MSTLPQSRKARIEYFEARLSKWDTNAAAIGLSAGQVASLDTLVSAARSALDAAEQARTASKDSTVQFYSAEDAMRDLGADLIKTIRAFAQTTNNPDVYALASIPPPAQPTPAPAPAQPADLSGMIDPFGVVGLAWQSVPKGPTSGIFFDVERRVGQTGAWTPLGATQEARFHDTGGAAQAASEIVQYRVRARRGESASPWSDPLAVSFTGTEGDVAGFVGGPQAEAA